MVSIHCNAAGNGSDWMIARGWEAWTSVGKTKADKLATCLYDAAGRAGFKLRKARQMATRTRKGTSTF